MDIREYAKAFDRVERDYEDAVAEYGIPFEATESCPRARRARTAAACGCRCENGGASLWRGWISPACLACRTGERAATFFVDLRCTRSCYFCFNPNQDDYEYFSSHSRDIAGELEQAAAAGARFGHLAITGGEPLLHKEQVLAFVGRAKALYPGVHVRLYTCGDLLDDACLAALARSGLDEIRFSIKPEDVSRADAPVFGCMAAAVEALPDVMVEMPVIPGTLSEMKNLLVRLDAMGVRGVNLLEFCFPLCNAEAFRERGFELRKHPFDYLYDYWYGGGVPVAGSEAEALALLEHAARDELRLGVHYCSSDNKNTGQISQQNKVFICDDAVHSRYAWFSADAGDRLLKCAKAFGPDVRPVLEWAQSEGVSCSVDEGVPSIAFPLAMAAAAREACPGAALAESANVFERREAGELYLREIGVRELRTDREAASIARIEA